MTTPKPSRHWHAVEVRAEAELADAIGAYLLNRGAPGLQIDERGGVATVTAHFETELSERDLETLFVSLGEGFPDAGRPELRLYTVEETEWAENWKTHFPSLAIGERLFVHPPWARDVPAGRLAVELDPGMAFGTGQHPSTRGCLACLDALVRPEAAPRVLDLGTGSGILAIAAIKLGAAAALAVDIDPLSCEIAAANAATNGVADRIEVATQLEPQRGDFDIIVANLFSGMLIGFANDIARRLRPGGHAIGAGLEAAEAAAVSEAWSEAGLQPVREIEVEGWTTLVFNSLRS